MGDNGRGGRGGQFLNEASFQTIDSADSHVDMWGSPQRVSPTRGWKGGNSRRNESFAPPKREDSYRSTDSSGNRGAKNAERLGFPTSRMQPKREDSARFHINEIKNGGYYAHKERKQEHV